MKNLRIRIQLLLGFSAILMLVVILGFISYFQSNEIHKQTVAMYEHPLRTRQALEEIDKRVLMMRMNIRDFLLVEKPSERLEFLNEMAINQTAVMNGVEALRKCYLGPPSDIDRFTEEFTRWVSIRSETVRLVSAGHLEEARIRHRTGGVAPRQALQVLGALKKISDFASGKGDELYANSLELRASLTKQLVGLIGLMLVLSIILIYILLRNFRIPLEELTRATQLFRGGDFTARSNYQSYNEMGKLSDSFNKMAQKIQEKSELDEKFVNLASLMLNANEETTFFKILLQSLAGSTSAHMGAIYLYYEDKKSLEYLDSFGLNEKCRQTFGLEPPQGEFGAAIISGKIQHITTVPNNTRFEFLTVGGKFIPSEMIAIPVVTGNRVIAVISLATLNTFSAQTLQLLDNVFLTLCARIEGVLGYRKIGMMMQEMVMQNRELEAQKDELSAQSRELVQQNLELEMQKKQLGEVSRLKTNFLSNMSHELRTPLNSVIALTGVLNRRLANLIPAEEYSYLEVIERNGKHLLALINDILDISRIEAGREEVEINTFNLNHLVNEVAELVKNQADQKQLRLNINLENNEITVSTDASKCRHILLNLIGNAIKFTEKGSITISTRLNSSSVELRITDTGIGISDQHLPHIFDEFRQADSSTSRRFGGTGLGLAIARKYAHMLGGELTVKSTPGVGSEFTLNLPLKYSNQNDTQTSDVHGTGNLNLPAPHPAGTAVYGKGKTILLIEDSEPAIIQMRDILETAGFRLLVALHGMDGLKILEETIPDGIILDLMMPGIDGFEVLKSIKENDSTAHLPVLILTAKHITKEELKVLKQNHIHQLIQKGDVNRSELLVAVNSMVTPEPGMIELPPRKALVLHGKPKVLIVEDNPDNMLTVKAILSEKFIILESPDGEQGVEMARTDKPDLILMDIALPGLDGISAFRLIRNDPATMHIPIIALTASAMISDRETILAHGFDGYVAKPIEESILFQIINEILYGK